MRLSTGLHDPPATQTSFDQAARVHTLPRVVTGGELAALGVSSAARKHAVATGRWHRLARAVYLTQPGPPTRDDWILVGMALTGPAAALSGWDAVRLRGLGAREPPSPDVLVLDRVGAHRRVGHVVVRPTGRTYATSLLPWAHPTLPYVPVVHPARAIADTALLYPSFVPVRALVTSAIQRSVCRPDQLVAELEHSPRQGSRWYRRALRDVVAGAKSVAEAEGVDFLTRARVPAFEVNVPIVDRFGVLLAEADVLWRELRMILEVDSREFHFGEDDWKRTMHRHTMLTRRGFLVEHHAPSDIRAGRSAWAAGIATGLRARARELGVPYVPGRGPIPVPPGGHRPVISR